MAFVGINYLAVLVAAVAAWVLGAVWYRVLSTQWLAALGKTHADITRPDGKPKSYVPFILVFVAELIMAWAGLAQRDVYCLSDEERAAVRVGWRAIERSP